MRIRNTPDQRPGLGDRVRWRVIVNGVHEDFELEGEGTVIDVLEDQYVVEDTHHITRIIHKRDLK